MLWYLATYCEYCIVKYSYGSVIDDLLLVITYELGMDKLNVFAHLGSVSLQ